MAITRLPRIAIATGDPAGIGPEISLKAALDAQVRAMCRPLIVGDPTVLDLHARAAGITAPLRVVTAPQDADWTNDAVNLLAVPMPEPTEVKFGTNAAAYGRAALVTCSRAIRAALDGDIEAVLAAPQNQTSIAAANIPFDGHPSFVASETGMERHDVFMMLWFGNTRIVHCTLHVGVAEALALITLDRVGRTIRATDVALRRFGIATPRILVSGLNPHAGEGGLFGREEIDIIVPAIAAARQTGIDVAGPFGCDTVFHKTGADAFVVMLHDQGHIAAKLQAPNQAAAFAIGSPILFASVAHGSAFDIAG
ncbi:MAG TPA: 4-hydroxythreonine-4-phosphate dehydrogenase PdxA, partial [Xanthobacteraceae bacterium]|nr:4-hydroxythreonine-4-phosphate dehydrogenase PdxA [Xanthobacteraceae bacterium]